MNNILPVGKLPSDLLASLLAKTPQNDPRVLLGPGIGLDCAVLESRAGLLVLKSDPITFATDQIGWYAVQISSNDIATTGATPRWLLAALLLPEKQTTPDMVEAIHQQICSACNELQITLIGGHTEITYDLNRPILIATMIGETPAQSLITPKGAHPGDQILITKGVPVEATSLLAREYKTTLSEHLSPEELAEAQNFLYNPGINVLRDAQIAKRAGKVTAMHDPTEGGLLSALWELSEACGHGISFTPAAVPVPALSARICQIFHIDPFAAIASGALLMAVDANDAAAICQALQAEGIACARIGEILAESVGVWHFQEDQRLPVIRPERDEIARVFEN